MNQSAGRKGPPKRRPQQRKGRTATVAAAKGGKGNNRTTWIIVAVVVAVGGALVFALASSSDKKKISNQADAPAPKALVSKVTGVSDDVINAVGSGSVNGLPIRVKDKVAVLATKDGKPRILYLGAEYCPFCATERWAMVNALSRFGKFSGLKTTTSGAPPEQFPNTATFSFYGSKFDSDYIQFEPVEQETNTRAPLETPTSEQEALLAKYDVAPYTSQDGAIPFIDFANQFIISGASYDAGVLAGLTHDQIAAALSDSSSNISKGAIGTANGMTAAICELTKNKPTNVCSQPAVKDLQSQL